MNRTTATVITGMAAVVAVSTAAYMLTGRNNRINMKRMRRTAGKAVRAVGEAINDITDMFR